MGGHGGLNILPQKSWHVWNRANRERVARDEAEAAQQAADEEFNAAAERAGLNLMKLRARVTGEAGPSTTDRHVATAGAGHVNFFADAEAAELLAQRDAAAKRKEAQEISRIMPDLDLSKSAREPKPWYAMPPRERAGDDAAPAGAGVVDAAVLWLPAPAIIPEGVADEGKHTRKRERHHRKHDKHDKHGKHDKKKKKKKHHAHHDERAPAEALSESDEEAEARVLRANSSLMPPPRPPPAPATAAGEHQGHQPQNEQGEAGARRLRGPGVQRLSRRSGSCCPGCRREGRLAVGGRPPVAWRWGCLDGVGRWPWGKSRHH
jgi:hypothetical protein